MNYSSYMDKRWLSMPGQPKFNASLWLSFLINYS
jgi:hypothetical protein